MRSHAAAYLTLCADVITLMLPVTVSAAAAAAQRERARESEIITRNIIHTNIQRSFT